MFILTFDYFWYHQIYFVKILLKVIYQIFGVKILLKQDPPVDGKNFVWSNENIPEPKRPDKFDLIPWSTILTRIFLN